uniref:Uncharacterized protein n=1 Tax=Anguilla anguilla TaxID=7936 RepID=A0A0E9P8B5_ANGAN
MTPSCRAILPNLAGWHTCHPNNCLNIRGSRSVWNDVQYLK